jgi:hypothetical protein
VYSATDAIAAKVKQEFATKEKVKAEKKVSSKRLPKQLKTSRRPQHAYSGDVGT